MGVPIPLTLLDAPRDARARPLTDLRISVVDRCNFRCPYCMPEDQYPQQHRFLDKREQLSFEEIERLARAFARQGVHKLRLTGGEPLLRRELPLLVSWLARVPGIDDIALTTNGVLLPRFIEALRDAGLKRLTVSLDSLDSTTFQHLSGGRSEVADVLAGIAAAEAAGFRRIKLNCVVVRGVNDTGVLDLAEHFRGTGHIVRFIEYMDVGTLNNWRSERVVPSMELLARIHARWPVHVIGRARASDVAERYAFDDGGGEIGFISSVSAPFCGDCSRARLSADGRFYTCLFSRDGYDLRGPLREGISDDALAALLSRRWQLRADRYSERRAELRAAGPREHVEMFAIGG